MPPSRRRHIYTSLAVILWAVPLLAGAGPAAARPAPPRAERLAAELPVLTPRLGCADLAGADVSTEIGTGMAVTSAAIATAGGGYEVCDVRGVIATQIQFQVQLPTRTYRQRYLQTGCGGLCGTLSITVQAAAGCAPVTGGAFATAANNQGHVGGDGLFGTDPQLRVDFAYRADHVTALAAKALISRFYGQRPRYSYFDGCSQGGHEGLTEAQRYPDDFDGILAGAPASITTELNTFNQPWLARIDFDAAGRVILPASKLPVLHAAVMARCDRLDGLADGQVDDPRRCDFDPASIACTGADAPTCLTAAQVAVVRKAYSGPVDGPGQHLYPGGQAYGSELAWAGWFIPQDANAPQSSTTAWRIGNPWVKYLAFEPNPPLSYTLNDIAFDRATFDRARRLSGLYDAIDPDLTAFKRSGGKLVLWHGWSDQAIPATGTVAYYRAVQDRMGGLAATRSFARLFMFPGMYHCAGGTGPSTFDLLTGLMNWVEADTAPTRVVAARVVDGKVTRTRPVFAYPQVARYDGAGSSDDAANFVPVTPPPSDDHFSWLGRFEGAHH